MLEKHNTDPPNYKLKPMIDAHIARYTSPPTQYLGPNRGYSNYNPLMF
jgi:hypothetical protein